MAVLISVTPKTSPIFGEAFIKRLTFNAPHVHIANGRDRTGAFTLLFPELTTVAHVGHAATGIRNSSEAFWDIVRDANHIPSSFKGIPKGNMLINIDDRINAIRKKAVNLKIRPTAIDRVNFVQVGVYPVNVRNIPTKSRGIGVRNIHNLLSVKVDGR